MPVASDRQETRLGAGRPPALAVQAVSHAYRTRHGATVPALDSLSLDAARGEFIALLGRSGCGKTTLLRIVAGLLTPTRGQVFLDGASPQAARAQHAVGWLAQDDGLFPWRTVRDNVALPLIVGRSPPVNHAALAALLGRVGLADSAHRYPHELSGGMRQRAALARALAGQPALLLLDEPFAHLDELTRERLGDLLLEVRHAATTALLVTHSVTEAARLADRVVVVAGPPGAVAFDVTVPFSQSGRADAPGFDSFVRALKGAL